MMNTFLPNWLPHNLYVRVLLAMVGCIAVVLIGGTIVTINQTHNRLSNDLLARGRSQVQILTTAANAYVADRDTSHLTLMAAATTARNDVQYVAFYDATGGLLAAGAAPSAPLNVRTAFKDLRSEAQATGTSAVKWSEEYLDIAAPITWINQDIGTIGLRMDISALGISRRQALEQALITGLILMCSLSLAIGVLLRILVIVPLRRFGVASEQISRGIWMTPVGQDRRDELGRVARSFAQMVTALQNRETQLQEQIGVVQELNSALDQKVAERTAELHKLVGTQEQLLNQIHQMSLPVVPVLEGVIIIPIIGSLDHGRAAHLIENVLSGICEHKAHLVIMDLTGVLVVDTQIAHVLIQVAQATSLLGAKTVLVGFRPEVAQTVIQLGVDLRAIQTFSSLQDALLTALNQRKFRMGQPSLGPTAQLT